MISEAPGTTTDPTWLTSLVADYQASVANTFLVHGNVFDYVDQPERDQIAREYLAGRLAKNFSVVQYAPDEGITFPGEQSALGSVRELAAETRRRFERITGLAAQMDEAERLLAQAGQGGDEPSDLPREPARALPKLVEFLSLANGKSEAQDGDGSGKRAVVIVDRLDLIAPPSDKGTTADPRLALLGLLHRVGTSREVNALGNLLLLLTPGLEEVHPDLRQASTGIQTIEIPPPSYEERLRYLERLIPTKRLLLEDITVEQVAKQMAGLGRRHIEDVALRARALTGGVLTPALVKARKKELISNEFSEVLTVLEPDVTLAMVGGHDLAKIQINRLLKAARSTDPRLRARMPKGILFAGPAGTGKTFVAQAVANALGWACLEFDPSKVNGMYVGQSERLLAKAMRGARAFAPCVLFIDEIDQRIKRVAGGSGGGGDQAAANQFGKMLEFLGDPSTRGQILTIGASNWGSRIDAALLRPGRLDWKIPLLAPESPTERADIVERLLVKNGLTGLTVAVGDVIDDLAATTDGWTPAELERLVNLALEIVDFDDLGLPEAITAARGRLKPTTREVRAMTLSALAICDDLALVPERWRDLVAEPVPGAVDDSRPYRPQTSGPREGQELAV